MNEEQLKQRLNEKVEREYKQFVFVLNCCEAAMKRRLKKLQILKIYRYIK